VIVIQPHTSGVNVVCFTPNGSLLASVSHDGWVKVWTPGELHTGKPVWEVDAEADEGGSYFSQGLSHAQFTPDGKLLITSGWRRHLRAWDARTGKPKWEVRKPRGLSGIGTLVVSRDGSRVAFAGGQLGNAEQVFVIDPGTQKRVKTLEGHDDACGALAAGPDGLASGGGDRRVKFWSWAGGQCYHKLISRGVVRGLMFSPDGSRFAAAGGTAVMVWDMVRPPRGRPLPTNLRQFRGHTDQIQALDFSPDSSTIASSAYDGTIRTWDVSTGAEVRAFHPQLGKLHHVAFAPDGLTLAFTSEKGHIGLLDLDR
jgi:WD40 repeat protein